MTETASSPATDVRVQIRAAARRAACHAIKSRARLYARRPSSLEVIFPGLSMAAPGTLIAIAEHLIENGRQSPVRWFGFGGEVALVNARAVLLLGRTLRRLSAPSHERARSTAGPGFGPG